MTLRTKALAAAFAGLLVVQLLPSATLAWRQTERLHTGRPLLLTVETRDPRDLFRGEYSRLAYEIGRLQAVPADPAGSGCDFAKKGSCALGAERTVYLRLAPDAEGVHRPVGASFVRPAGGEPFIAGKARFATLTVRDAALTGRDATPTVRDATPTVRDATPTVRDARSDKPTCGHDACLSGQVTYGIENWYGPQGVPARLDRMARRDIRVEARVDAEGVAILDGLRVGGEPFAKTARLWR